MKKSGFTLTELIAVIAVLSVLALVASVSITGMINKSKEGTNQTMVRSLEDAALAYYNGEKEFIPTSCGKADINSAISSSCVKKVTVEQLITKNYFTDTKGICDKNANIIIWRYKYTDTSGRDSFEIKSQIESGKEKACLK